MGEVSKAQNINVHVGWSPICGLLFRHATTKERIPVYTYTMEGGERSPTEIRFTTAERRGHMIQTTEYMIGSPQSGPEGVAFTAYVIAINESVGY